MSSDRRPSSRGAAVALASGSFAALAALAAIGALTALAGCGKQGDPAPRPRPVPQPARDLAVRQRGNELLFEVSYPKTTVAGMPIEGIASATLYEAVTPALVGNKVPQLREQELEGLAQPVIELSGASLDSAIVGDKIRFRIELPQSALSEPLPPPPPPAPATPATTPGTTATPTTTPGAPTTPTAAPPATPAVAAPTAPAPAPAPTTTASPMPPTSTPSPTSTPPPVNETPSGVPLPPDSKPLELSTKPSATTPVAPNTATGVQARTFSVRMKEERGLTSPWSNSIGIVPLIPPEPPGSLTVEAKKEGVALSWTASKNAIGYAVVRREATVPLWGAPIATLPVTATQYLDRGAVYGSRYVYTVLSIGQTAPPIESAPQTANEVDYRDVFAPVPPTALRALYVSGQVRLVWEPSADADLKGYIIQRSIGDGPFNSILGEVVTGSDATDPRPPSGALRYRLVAVDNSGNRANSEPAEIQVP